MAKKRKHKPSQSGDEMITDNGIPVPPLRPATVPREWNGYIPITHRRLLLVAGDQPTHRLDARCRLQCFITELLADLIGDGNHTVIWDIEKILRSRYGQPGVIPGILAQWLSYNMAEVQIAFEDVVNRTQYNTNPALYHYILDLRIQKERRHPASTEILVSDKMGAPATPTTLVERNVRCVEEGGPHKLNPIHRGVAGVEYEAVLKQANQSQQPKEVTMAIQDTQATTSVPETDSNEAASAAAQPQEAAAAPAAEGTNSADAEAIKRTRAETEAAVDKFVGSLKKTAKVAVGVAVIGGVAYGAYRMLRGGKPVPVAEVAAAAAQKADVAVEAVGAAANVVASFGRRFF